MKVIYIVYLVFTFISVQAQDSLYYQTESKKFYDKEYKDWSKTYRSYALEMLSKHDRSPLITERDSFRNEYFRKLRDTLKAKIDNKMQFKTELIDSLLEYRLILWNYRHGGAIPDSTFIVLMDAYFDIDNHASINFCIDNWDIRKIHIMDRSGGYKEIPWTKSHPYITFLYENLNSWELMQTLTIKNRLTKDENKKFIDFIMKDFGYYLKEFDKLRNYVKAFSEFVPKIQHNEYFIQKFTQ